MTLQELIERLENASKPELAFDGEIATLLGWRRKVEYVKSDSQGEDVKRAFWVVPSGDNPGTVPLFTTSLDAAIELMNTIAPSDQWGVSDGEGGGAATIDSGPYCLAATPAMALCIAALKTNLIRQSTK